MNYFHMTSNWAQANSFFSPISVTNLISIISFKRNIENNFRMISAFDINFWLMLLMSLIVISVIKIISPKDGIIQSTSPKTSRNPINGDFFKSLIELCEPILRMTSKNQLILIVSLKLNGINFNNLIYLHF
jgi:hypothetical protein